MSFKWEVSSQLVQTILEVDAAKNPRLDICGRPVKINRKRSSMASLIIQVAMDTDIKYVVIRLNDSIGRTSQNITKNINNIILFD